MGCLSIYSSSLIYIRILNKVYTCMSWTSSSQIDSPQANLSWPLKMIRGVVKGYIYLKSRFALRLASSFVSSVTLSFALSFAQGLTVIAYLSTLTGCEDSSSSLSPNDYAIIPPQNDLGQVEANLDEGRMETHGRESPIDSTLNSEEMSQEHIYNERQDQFYDPQIVQEIELFISDQDRQAMLDALPEQIYVPATFKWREVVIQNVGVRFKGMSSSQPNSWWKRSFLIKFSEYVEGQRFLGLRRVSLDNAVQFGSLFSERLITDILKAEEVPCSKTNYSTLTLNGRYEGVFVNVERIDKSFLERVFQNRQGILYKNHLGGPGSDLTVLNQASDYSDSFEPKTHKDEADYTEILELTTLLRDTPDPDLPSLLESRFELESFLKLMAVMVLSGAFDQYTGFNPHNYYLYDDPNTGLMTYLVWDLDVGFVDQAFGQLPIIDGWNTSWPLPQVPRPLLERVLLDEELRTRYHVHAERILETYFKPEYLGEKLDILFTQVLPYIQNDPYPARRATSTSDEDYPMIVQSLKSFMNRRYTTARTQLDNPLLSPPQPAQVMGEDPSPGASGPDDPSHLYLDRIDEEGVHLRWTDNSIREAINILQRCEGNGCEHFENRIGVPAHEPSEVIDSHIQSGKVYRYRIYAAWPTPNGPRGTGTTNVVEVMIP